MKKNSKKIFLSLGAILPLIISTPLLAASCESSLKSKLNRVLKTNKKYRTKLEQKLNIPSKFDSFKTSIFNELNSLLQNVSDKNKRIDIYKHIICAEFGWGFSEVSKSNQKFFDELFKGTRLTEQSDLSVLEFDTFKHIVDGFIDYWRWIENVRYNGEHTEIAKEIFSIYLVEKTRYKRYWTIPFVVAYFKAKGKSWSNYYIDSLRVNMYMFRFFLTYTVVNDRVINYVQNNVCDKCFKWFKECNTDKIIENIRKDLLPPVPNKEHNKEHNEEHKNWIKFYGIIESGLFDNGISAVSVQTR